MNYSYISKEKLAIRINKLAGSQRWSKIIDLVDKYNNIILNDHWFIAQKGIAQYERYDYISSLKTLNNAKIFAPECPLVNYYLSCVLRMLNNPNEAINILLNYMDIDINEVANGECGEGLRWAKSLINDMRYNLAMCFWDLKNYEMALKYINSHLNNRARGQFSNANKNEALDLLINIENNIDK